MHLQRSILVPVIACIALLSCGAQQRVSVSAPTISTAPIARKYPAHSAKWWRKLALFVVALKKAQHEADVRAWNAAVAANDYHNWPDWPLWHAVGLCEQRGPGPDGIAWSGTSAGGEVGSSYPGGLGMSRDFWATYAPAAGVTVSNGALASPADQIRVARAGSGNGTRMGGWSSWPGCVHAHGG